VARTSSDTVEVLREHWNARAARFDTEAEHGLRSDEQRQAWLMLLAPIAGPAPKRILDVGCGTGFLAMRFAELGHTVTGVDFAPNMLDMAREHTRQAGLSIEYRVDDAMHLSEPEQSYDVVIARHVIWTMPDPRKAVASWLRVLRHGGKLAIVEGKWADNAALARAHASPMRRAMNALVETPLSAAARIRGKKSETLQARKYRRIQAQLPFSGGPPRDALTKLLSESGVRNVETTPLMDARYWGEEPRFDRYIVVGER